LILGRSGFCLRWFIFALIVGYLKILVVGFGATIVAFSIWCGFVSTFQISGKFKAMKVRLMSALGLETELSSRFFIIFYRYKLIEWQNIGIYDGKYY
jgi:hypothetical protein